MAKRGYDLILVDDVCIYTLFSVHAPFWRACKPHDRLSLPHFGDSRSVQNMELRELGARLFFLPPDSPDLNPIEQMFAKPKHFLRC